MTLDIAVAADQEVTYEIYNGANPVAPGTTNSVRTGCNSFDINLSQYGLQPSYTYILLVHGDGWNESIQFMTR